MLNLFSITIFGLSIPPSTKETKSENGREAAKAMWQAILDLEKVLPHEASIFTYQDKNRDDYEINKNLIRETFPIQKHQGDAFLQQSVMFWQQAERQKPYLSKKLHKLIMDYEMFLSKTLTVAQHGGVISDLSFPWEQKHVPRSLSNRKQKRQYRRSSNGEECLGILKEAISDEVAKACS